MQFSDVNTEFLDKGAAQALINELKAYIDGISTGSVDLSSYVTKSELQAKLDDLHINIDLSSYATKEELVQAINNIDLSIYATRAEIPSLDGYAKTTDIPSIDNLATTEYVDNAIASVPTGGTVDLSDYYTKGEVYNKEETDALIPTVANGVDGKDGVSPTVTVTKEGKVATITCTDVNGTTTATISDGKDGTTSGGSGGASSGEIYSTEEVAIGTWIDGSTLYRKTFQLTGLSANTLQYFDMNTEFDEIISIVGINVCNSSSGGNFIPLNTPQFDSTFSISSNSVSNIKAAITNKTRQIIITKNSTYPSGAFISWQGNQGGTSYHLNVTVEYIRYGS